MTAANGSGLDRPHVWLPGEGKPVLLLHGTGGDEHDLLPLRERIAPDAATLSVRGGTLENDMPRFFRRLREGVFDEADMEQRADELADFLSAAEGEYGVEPGAWTAIGFSNGANIASALLFRRPAALAGAVLFAAMVPWRGGPPASDLTGKRVLLSNGERDPMATADQTATLTSQLSAAGADLTLLPHPGAHTIDGGQLPSVARWLAEDSAAATDPAIATASRSPVGRAPGQSRL